MVVGGGPVGLAAAIAARLHGLAVRLIERRQPPFDKACGEGLMPAGLAALGRLGVELPERGRRFAGIRYRADELVAEGSFPGGAHGLAIARRHLHEALVARAAACGVELAFGVAAERFDGAVLHTSAGELRAETVVAADGLRSPLRRAAGLELARRSASSGPDSHERFGVTRHFRAAPWCERVEVVFGDRAEAYVTPLADDEVGVAILWGGGKGGFDELLRERLPAWFAARLAGLAPLGRDLGAGPLEQPVRRRTAGALALVGDAGGYLDALTGEGLSLGFEQALALGEALAAHDLARYERAARALARLPESLTRWALFAARRPALRRRLVAALARDGELFTALLGALGARRPLGVGRRMTLLAGLALRSPARVARVAA